MACSAVRMIDAGAMHSCFTGAAGPKSALARAAGQLRRSPRVLQVAAEMAGRPQPGGAMGSGSASTSASMAELAVLNSRLEGKDFVRVRQAAEFLVAHPSNWERLYETGTLEDEAKYALAYLEEFSDKGDLSAAHDKLHLTEARVAHAVSRLQELEGEASALGLEDVVVAPAVAPAAVQDYAGYHRQGTKRFKKRYLATARSLATAAPDSGLRNFWFPVAFLSTAGRAADAGKPYPFDLFSETWELSRTAANGGWVVRNTGRSGPSSMAVAAADGFLWVFPGQGVSDNDLPPLPTQFAQPRGYTLHAEITVEDVPVEHGLLLENLLDLAHAPFTHTSTFARGWSVPDLVGFASSQLRPQGGGWGDMPAFLAGSPGARGRWQPYPIDMSFEAPVMVLSHIGLVQPGKLVTGADIRASDCAKHLHQLHACVPGKEGHTRLLYRMCLDFAPWAKHVPLISRLWREMANQVLGEDLRLVDGQQAALARGSSVWNVPVAYDKLGLLYRRWRGLVDVPGGATCAARWDVGKERRSAPTGAPARV